MRSKTDTFDSLTVFIALGNKEKLLKTHLNSQSYCLRKVPGQTCKAGFRGTFFQASRSDSIHSCDLLGFSPAAVLAAQFAIFSCVWTAGSRKNYPAVASKVASKVASTWLDAVVIPLPIIPVKPTLPLLAGDLRFFASSPALPLWYINLPLFTSTINIEYLVKNKTDFILWDLAHF